MVTRTIQTAILGIAMAIGVPEHDDGVSSGLRWKWECSRRRVLSTTESARVTS